MRHFIIVPSFEKCLETVCARKFPRKSRDFQGNFLTFSKLVPKPVYNDRLLLGFQIFKFQNKMKNGMSDRVSHKDASNLKE